MSVRLRTADFEPDPIADQAALWMVRRDVGLTPEQQDEYIQWLSADPRHARALARHAAAFERMMQLYELQPGQSHAVNPDLFVVPMRRRRWRVALSAAAAVLALGIGLWTMGGGWGGGPGPQGSYLRITEREALPDGSIVELKDGSRLGVAFSASERRVQLEGEAHFTVAKRPEPFVVEVNGVAVQAVGTAFNVRSDAGVVDVIVTEGTVRMQSLAGGGSGGAVRAGASSPASEGRLVVAGQRAQVAPAGTAAVRVRDVEPEEMNAALAWKVPRFQFFDTPLAVVVAEFNRLNRVRLVLEPRELGRVQIGGTFRVDNVDGFVRLLEATLGIVPVADGDNRIILTRASGD